MNIFKGNTKAKIILASVVYSVVLTGILRILFCKRMHTQPCADHRSKNITMEILNTC